MEVEKNLEVKKKFEKPQMEVVQLKPAGMVCKSCFPDVCDMHGCDDD
ncbi:MAG: hypothetical protein J5953_06435 [Prevotella sp.]|nr:hypothetical protein [Prevotella sp.]